ncbi:hypothetical protein [Nannocystis sp. SCPEA4]|uniref:hypothetical protein n=1 Tax=Nannocystis sp. SCPEA4 TaxID=2996787 RepID=UPI00226ED529|nr:hypothetical protein [Nannocystis sp. SCPEA4]MCY1055659.1 hypothetical protein [Nannocystis sp. SCPEA4]
MTERTYNVGDVVAWSEVQDGWLVLDTGSDLWADSAYVLRLAGRGRWIHEERVTDWTLTLDDWPWETGEEVKYGANGVTIIAMNLTGKETAGDLQGLAEAFAKRAVSA